MSQSYFTCESFYHMDRTADFNVLIYVTEGIIYVTEDGRDYEISPGEILFLKAGLRHFGKYKTPRGTSWFYAHFNLSGEIDSDCTMYLPKKAYIEPESDTSNKLRKLYDCCHSTDKFEVIRKNSVFYDILLDIGMSQRSKCESLSDRICSYLDNHTDEDFTKALIHRQFFMSYSYLVAEFKKDKGISMGRYHNNARMKKACNLLRTTLMSVSDIALSLGFTDILYFSRKFHDSCGVSPTEYRRMLKDKY